MYVSPTKVAYQYSGLVVNSLAWASASAVTLRLAEWKIYGASGCVTVRFMGVHTCVLCVCIRLCNVVYMMCVMRIHDTDART